MKKNEPVIALQYSIENWYHLKWNSIRNMDDDLALESLQKIVFFDAKKSFPHFFEDETISPDVINAKDDAIKVLEEYLPSEKKAELEDLRARMAHE